MTCSAPGARAAWALDGNQVNVKTPGLDPMDSMTTAGRPDHRPAGRQPRHRRRVQHDPRVTVPTHRPARRLRGAAGLDAGSSPDIGAYEASSSYLVTTTADSYERGDAPLRHRMGQPEHQRQSARPSRPPTPIQVPRRTRSSSRPPAFSTPQTITLSPSLGTIAMINTVNTRRPSTARPQRADDQRRRRGGRVLGRHGHDGDPHRPDHQRRLAATSGGAINNAGTLTVINSTLTGNSAATGGAIDNLGTLDLQSPR